MERTNTETETGDGLLGATFTTPKDLRHLAEQCLGQLFVPTEVVHAGDRAATLVLRPEGMGEILVQAERERHFSPYVITRVEHVERHAR